ncbi:surface antigen-domain-containing protein [Podospora conica]|nr:surface antigen-domain-containing protein [Schizothecium conicum]
MAGPLEPGNRNVVDPSPPVQASRTVLDNALTPVTINRVEINGAFRTRRSYLDPVFKPLVDDGPIPTTTTIGDVVDRINVASEKLASLGVFKEDIRVSIAQALDNPHPTAESLNLIFNVQEKGLLVLSAGTSVGNTEGSAVTHLQLRNILGGSETLTLDASTGTRTRAAYQAALSTPVLNNPALRLSLEGTRSSIHKPWASHTENLTSGILRLALDKTHTLSLSTTHRQITSLAATASPAVRSEAGDSLKTSLSHTFTRDRRTGPFPFIPSRGYLIRTISELAGWGPLQGDVSFAKSEVELAAVAPLGPPGVTVGGSFRAGALLPLPFGYALSGPTRPSRISDRFQLGGPTDVRVFQLGGLGPHDGKDAVGGDVYAAAGVNVMVPLPRVGAESPLRMQAFVSAGRLVALRSSRWKGRGGLAGAVEEVVGGGLPSMAAGVGLVYAHPIGRFELNFGLPLVVRRGEEGRKGLQLGVGITFM